MVRFRSAPGWSNRVLGCGIVEGDIRQLQSAGLFLGGQIGNLKFSLVRHELELPFTHGADKRRSHLARLPKKATGKNHYGPMSRQFLTVRARHIGRHQQRGKVGYVCSIHYEEVLR